MGNNIVRSFFSASNPPSSVRPMSLMALLMNPSTRSKECGTDGGNPLDEDMYFQRFKEYLKERNLSEEENILAFMISYSSFLKKTQELESNKPKKTKQQLANLKKQRKQIFLDICKDFFNYENPDMLICLNSSVLMDALNNSLEQSNEEPNYSLLERVVQDNSVKDIETTFKQFMLKMDQQRIGCILSLL